MPDLKQDKRKREGGVAGDKQKTSRKKVKTGPTGGENEEEIKPNGGGGGNAQENFNGSMDGAGSSNNIITNRTNNGEAAQEKSNGTGKDSSEVDLACIYLHKAKHRPTLKLQVPGTQGDGSAEAPIVVYTRGQMDAKNTENWPDKGNNLCDALIEELVRADVPGKELGNRWPSAFDVNGGLKPTRPNMGAGATVSVRGVLYAVVYQNEYLLQGVIGAQEVQKNAPRNDKPQLIPMEVGRGGRRYTKYEKGISWQALLP